MDDGRPTIEGTGDVTPTSGTGEAGIDERLPVLADWPRVQSRVRPDPGLERAVADLVGRMTVAEKVGQITQPDIAFVTPADVREHHIGSVLNGGGAWPGADKHATAQDWLALADAYWDASVTSNSATRIPVVWGTDAVHGHSNVHGMTVFPHNIGLGAARDPGLLREIGAATARQVRATGQDWAFAPTVAVPRDDRWGRTYEGYSEDPRVTSAYAYEAVIGLQGEDAAGIGADGVIACAKHYLGDGGTTGGTDQGVTAAAEAELINVHGRGYYRAIAAGVQTVMASFSSWSNPELGITECKVHGSSYLLTEVLKNRLGFDGLVVSDWNGVGQVDGCTNSSCPRAINAGIDVVMVPQDWRAFVATTIGQVESGEIPMTRLDDAVTRILRVKMRAGVFEQPKPSERLHAGDDAALLAPALARRAVRQSLVLLKNDDNLLPLAADAKVLVVGKSADSMQNQTGGWTLTWQGTGNTNADFPAGTTILGGLREALGADNVTFGETAEGVRPGDYDAVIAVIGETPYAEGVGDLGRRTLEAAQRFPEDLAVLDRVAGHGTPVVTVLVTGRPLWVNRELNRSAAFVVAWLPGTEGGGVADLLVQGPNTGAGFTGRLTYSWPRSACQATVNVGDADYDPLFPYGYGLSNGEHGPVGVLDETGPVGGCPDVATDGDLDLFVWGDFPPYRAFVGAPESAAAALGNADTPLDLGNVTATVSEVNVQLDARRIRWTGSGPAEFYLEDRTGAGDLSHLDPATAIVFDVIVHEPPAAAVVLRVVSEAGSAEAVVTGVLRRLPVGERATVKVPLRSLRPAVDLTRVSRPFLVRTDGALTVSFANIRWVPGAADDDDAVGSADLE